MMRKFNCNPYMIGAVLSATILAAIASKREQKDREESEKLVKESTQPIIDGFLKEYSVDFSENLKN